MTLLTRHRFIFGSIITLVAGYCFFYLISNANQGLLDDLLGSVSGPVKSVASCEVFSNEISQNCTYMDEESRGYFVKQVLQAKKSLRPSHSKTIKMHLIKIKFVADPGNNENTNCFLVDELEGVDDLYFSRIDAGINCSNSSFKYLEGSVKVTNFLSVKIEPPVPSGSASK